MPKKGQSMNDEHKSEPRLKAEPDDHLHMYAQRTGRCWCGAHRDDWLRNEDLLEKIGQAFKHLTRKPDDQKL
jgi:hypothetical protein